jgi:putative transposase
MLQKTSNSIYSIKYHLVLVVKYRKPIINDYKSFISSTVNSFSSKHKFSVDLVNYDIDHAHMLISAKPDISPSQIVKVIKQHTSYELWNNFESELKKNFWKKHIFWNRSCYISTVGDIDKSQIEEYIKNQGKTPRLSVNLKV